MFYITFKLSTFSMLETVFQVFRKGVMQFYHIFTKQKKKALSAHGCLPLSILSCKIFLQNIARLQLNSKYIYT